MFVLLFLVLMCVFIRFVIALLRARLRPPSLATAHRRTADKSRHLRGFISCFVHFALFVRLSARPHWRPSGHANPSWHRCCALRLAGSCLFAGVCDRVATSSPQPSLLAMAWVCMAVAPLRAQINSLQTGQPIPGTVGITLGPGIDLSGWNSAGHSLQYGDFSDNGAGGVNLAGTTFDASWLDNASFYGVLRRAPASSAPRSQMRTSVSARSRARTSVRPTCPERTWATRPSPVQTFPTPM